jgi:hypothetical protein
MKQNNPINPSPILVPGLPANDASPLPKGSDLPSRDWAALVFRPLVISGLVTCVAAGWIIQLEFFLPGWQGEYLIPLVALVTLEMLLVEQQLRTQRLDQVQRFQIRLGEMVVILLLLKPATYLPRGWLAFLADSQQWLRQPGLFFDQDYMFGAMVLLLMWPLAMDIAGCLVALQDSFSPQDREWGLAGLKERFMLGALILLMAVGLQHVDFSPIGLWLRPGHASALTWLPLIYFGLGLLLFGQARLALLQASWEREQVPVTPTLTRRWASWGVLFVGGVTVLALLMPAGDTVLGFYLLVWLMLLVSLIGQLLIFIWLLLLGLILSPCLALFKVQQISTPRPPELTLLQAPLAQATGPAWLFYLRLTVFWIVVIVLLYVVLRIYWRERQAVGGWGIWRGFVRLWQALWAWLVGWKDRAVIRFSRPAAEQAIKLPAAVPGWWQRWRARTARERVRRLYLALLSRAAQAGHPRRPDQTPLEYVTTLKPHVAGEENALDMLTSAFVEARYGRRDFQPQEVGLLRRIWQRLQTVLRKQ